MSSPQTPRSRTESEIKRAGLNKKQADSVRKKLLMGNVVLNELHMAKEAQKTDRSRISVLRNMVAGKVLKKYKCITAVSRRTGLSRNSLGSATLNPKGKILLKPVCRRKVTEKFIETVVTFLQREDNSRMQPGKSDW